MSNSGFIKTDIIEQVAELLTTEFGFEIIQKKDDGLTLELKKFLSIDLYYNKVISDFTQDFLKSHELEDSTAFYTMIDLIDFNIWFNLTFKNNLLDTEIYRKLIKDIFLQLSKILSLEIVLNFNEQYYIYLKSGIVQLELQDFR